MLAVTQTPGDPAAGLALLIMLGLVGLGIFLVQVIVLRWIIRVNVIVKNQERIIELLWQISERPAAGPAP